MSASDSDEPPDTASTMDPEGAAAVPTVSDTGGPGGPTPRRAARGGRHRRRRRHRKLKWTLGILGSVIVLLAAAVGGYTIYLNSKIVRITVKNLKPAPKKGTDASEENILMVGSTSRCVLTCRTPPTGCARRG